MIYWAKIQPLSRGQRDAKNRVICIRKFESTQFIGPALSPNGTAILIGSPNLGCNLPAFQTLFYQTLVRTLNIRSNERPRGQGLVDLD